MKSLLAAISATTLAASLAFSVEPALAGSSNPMSQSYNASSVGKTTTTRADVRKQRMRDAGQGPFEEDARKGDGMDWREQDALGAGVRAGARRLFAFPSALHSPRRDLLQMPKAGLQGHDTLCRRSAASRRARQAAS